MLALCFVVKTKRSHQLLVLAHWTEKLLLLSLGVKAGKKLLKLFAWMIRIRANQIYVVICDDQCSTTFWIGCHRFSCFFYIGGFLSVEFTRWKRWNNASLAIQIASHCMEIAPTLQRLLPEVSKESLTREIDRFHRTIPSN
jgi:hypothetical protein